MSSTSRASDEHDDSGNLRGMWVVVVVVVLVNVRGMWVVCFEYLNERA